MSPSPSRLLWACVLLLGACDPADSTPVASEMPLEDASQFAPPGAIVVSAPATARRGDTVLVTVTLPVNRTGVNVYLPSTEGPQGAGACPASLGGQCFGITGPLTIHGPQPSVAGVAQFSIDLTGTYATGEVSFQAGVYVGRAFLSQPITIAIQDGCGGVGDTLESSAIGTLNCIPDGSFTMGCVAGRDDADGVPCGLDESPTHTVELTRSFWMMESEVTQGQWQALMGNNPSYFGPNGTAAGYNPGSPDHPVEQVNWWDALTFANAASVADGLPACYAPQGCTGTAGVNLSCTAYYVLTPNENPYECEGYRLPTEAEWEYAARGGEGYQYAGGSDGVAAGWCSNNNGPNGTSTYGTKPVCTKGRNAFELCDMTGNVFEWAWDVYGTYPSAPVTDPLGPTSATYRTYRGGSWWISYSSGRVANRERVTRGSKLNYHGFRLVQTAPL